MENKLPKVFANAFDKEIVNNKKVYYSGDERGVVTRSNNKNRLSDKTVEEKISAIFNSVNYVYKADVDITLNSGRTRKRIIGRNRDNLITMDNEVIPINSIIDIEYSE